MSLVRLLSGESSQISVFILALVTYCVPQATSLNTKVNLNFDHSGGNAYLTSLVSKYGLKHDPGAPVELSYHGGYLKAKYLEDSRVHVDFTSGQLKWRQYHGGGEAIARAVGVKSNYHPYVIDATGGFGTDAFILASHGCKVKLFEKDPLVACLLEDGFRRAGDVQGGRLTENFAMEFGDSLAYLTTLVNGTRESNDFRSNATLTDVGPPTNAPSHHSPLPEFPDVIYLDPMFPKSKNSALVKKNIKFLQNILPPNDAKDAELIRVALRSCRRRVVVKRPIGAACLGNLKTTNFVKSNRYRFDIYTPKSFKL
ncbi:hypothetical protein M8J76_004982 [Diaphorina citri]|nr:hypothetical protein M8J76_004982 [Diaphorina citri]KAI5724730.1 hypothetical protein M8J77_006534 [Diaphorina citri]